jgi:hypothetical protein
MKARGSFVGDAPTRGDVAALQSGDPGWLHPPEPGGSQ